MSDTTTRMSWDVANSTAVALVRSLRPHCERIEIAGSIRRLANYVGDIEAICIPKRVGLMEDSAIDPVLQTMVEADKLRRIKNGEKMKQFDVVSAGCKLDLFIVEPETWGVQFLIRTGPADFSRRFVTQQVKGGLLPNWMHVKDGRIWEGEIPLETPEEEDVFKVLGIDFITPDKRH